MHIARIPRAAAPPSSKRSFKLKHLVGMRSCQHSLDKEINSCKGKRRDKDTSGESFFAVGAKNPVKEQKEDEEGREVKGEFAYNLRFGEGICGKRGEQKDPGDPYH